MPINICKQNIISLCSELLKHLVREVNWQSNARYAGELSPTLLLFMYSVNQMILGITEQETSVKITVMSRWHMFVLVTMYPCRLSSKQFSFLIGDNGIKDSGILLSLLSESNSNISLSRKRFHFLFLDHFYYYNAKAVLK